MGDRKKYWVVFNNDYALSVTEDQLKADAECVRLRTLHPDRPNYFHVEEVLGLAE